MNIEISFDPKYGYSASIIDISTHTQGKTWDELIYNINESIACYAESEKKKKSKSLPKDSKFYLNFNNILNAGKLQRTLAHS